MSIRLSDAIRLGSVTGEQIRWHLINEQGNTCAIGGAMVAVGIKPLGAEDHEALWRMFPGLNDGTFEGCLQAEIVNLNNLYGMTRDQIADWLVESGKDIQSVEAPVPVYAEIGSTCSC